MNKEQIINQYNKTLKELEDINKKINQNGKLNLLEDNYYLGLTFISKISGLLTIFNQEFIDEYHLKPVVDWINKKIIMMQVSQYSDKNLFYEFFNVIYPQLIYRFEQISYFNSLSKEEQKQLVITSYYQVYLYKCLKSYLEESNTEEVQQKIKEILLIINLYQIDDSKIALGSKIKFQDLETNQIYEGRIVLPSHAKDSEKKLSLNTYKCFLTKQKDDVVQCKASSWKILDFDNTLEL